MPEEAEARFAAMQQINPFPPRPKLKQRHKLIVVSLQRTADFQPTLIAGRRGNVGTAQNDPIGREKLPADRTEARPQACCLFAKHLSRLWVRC
jgi:hypothetical protein